MIIMPVQTYLLSDVMGFMYQQANLDIPSFLLKQHLISIGQWSVEIYSDHKLVYNNEHHIKQSTTSEVSDDDIFPAR